MIYAADPLQASSVKGFLMLRYLDKFFIAP